MQILTDNCSGFSHPNTSAVSVTTSTLLSLLLHLFLLLLFPLFLFFLLLLLLSLPFPGEQTQVRFCFYTSNNILVAVSDRLVVTNLSSTAATSSSPQWSHDRTAPTNITEPFEILVSGKLPANGIANYHTMNFHLWEFSTVPAVHLGTSVTNLSVCSLHGNEWHCVVQLSKE